MRRKALNIFICVLALASLLPLSACGKKAEKPGVRVLIVPKFEIGDMSGDDPGEAQLFYEAYCAGCGEIAIPNSTPTAHFYTPGMENLFDVGRIVIDAVLAGEPAR